MKWEEEWEDEGGEWRERLSGMRRRLNSDCKERERETERGVNDE